MTTWVSGVSLRPNISYITGWMRERFDRHAHVYFGISGTTLLFEVLKREARKTMVLPAYICPSISAAAHLADKRIVHIDADRNTQLPDCAQLEQHLFAEDPSNTVVLIDHSFGYPFPGLARIRAKFPQAVIIEDCVRALGVKVSGESPGKYSDLILFSMYKATRGSSNGAILLANRPIGIKSGEPARITFRDRVSTNALLRCMYHTVQRYRGPESWAIDTSAQFPTWHAAYGSPHRLCVARFIDHLKELDRGPGPSIAEELVDRLSRAGIQCVRPVEGQHLAGHFVSLLVPKPRRDGILESLHKKGLFLARTWSETPAHFRGLCDTFPFGHANADYIADRVLHIRVDGFRAASKRRRLVEELQKVAC